VEQENDGRSGADVIRENVETRAGICAKFYWFVKYSYFFVFTVLKSLDLMFVGEEKGIHFI